MLAKATLRHASISPRKVRGVLNLIRGRRVGEAISMLKHLPKKSSRLVEKLVLSAVANAENQGQKDVDALIVSGCFVDNGPLIKRWMPRSMGRANRIQHRTSHISVLLGN